MQVFGCSYFELSNLSTKQLAHIYVSKYFFWNLDNISSVSKGEPQTTESVFLLIFDSSMIYKNTQISKISKNYYLKNQ